VWILYCRIAVLPPQRPLTAAHRRRATALPLFSTLTLTLTLTITLSRRSIAASTALGTRPPPPLPRDTQELKRDGNTFCVQRNAANDPYFTYHPRVGCCTAPMCP